MKRKTSTYKKRIKELITTGFSNQDIQSMIHQEYQIHFLLSEISKKRDNNKGLKETANNNTELYQLTINALELNKNIPQSAQEISIIIKNSFQQIYAQKQISRQLKSMPHLIEHSDFTGKYKLISKAKNENPQKTKEQLKIYNLINIDELNQIHERDILFDLQQEILQRLIQINSGNKKFDEIVRSIVRDNTITAKEEAFLRFKAEELNVSYAFLEKAQNALHENNPYFDNLIHLVFEDSKIEENEIEFLQEKIQENGFSIDYFNIRFWQIAITEYQNVLLLFNDFNSIIKLWGLNKILQKSIIDLKTEDFFTSLCIKNGNSFEEIIAYGKSFLMDYFVSEIDLKLEDLEMFLASFDLHNESSQVRHHDEKSYDMTYIKKVIIEEKRRIGDPSAVLLAENILFRLEN